MFLEFLVILISDIKLLFWFWLCVISRNNHICYKQIQPWPNIRKFLLSCPNAQVLQVTSHSKKKTNPFFFIQMIKF